MIHDVFAHLSNNIWKWESIGLDSRNLVSNCNTIFALSKQKFEVAVLDIDRRRLRELFVAGLI